jgi:medium-chain acyl-[acyl-carrier-protein] hydrolase
MTTNGSWFISYPSRPDANPRLFCFPYAGGSAAIFRHWSQRIPFEIFAVEYPGRGLRRSEPPATRSSVLIDQIVAAIRPYLDRPFAVFGHSMGAFVSFEVLRRLRAAGAPDPTGFVVSGCRAPTVKARRKPAHTLPESEFIEELRSLGGTPDEVLADRDLLRLLLPTLRADFELAETYVCKAGPKISCPVFAYAGIKDPDITREEVEAWRDECASSFRLRIFPGDHFFIHSAEALLLHALSHDLLFA